MWKRRWVRVVLRSLLVLVAAIGALLLYAQGFDTGRVPPGNPAATAADLPFLANPAPPRGRLLAVVSSAPRLADGRRKGGYELTELARAYWVFRANGYEVDIASPLGGTPPVVIDEDLVDADYAFLNDAEAQAKVTASIALDDVDPSRYAGVYFVGGKGTMMDFPDNPHIARLVRDIDARGGVIAAVCHGPAALLGLTRDDGRPFLDGRRLTAFTNDEELFLIEDAETLFGGLLQDRLAAAGASFVEGPMYLDNTVVDGRLVTGQNPWSTWSVAEQAIRALGHEPVPRETSGEEHAVAVLQAYRKSGYDAARAVRAARAGVDVRLLLLHALVAAMRGDWAHAFQLQRLAHG